MKRVLVVPFLALMGAVALGQVAQAQKPRVIEIEVGDTMKFSVESIEAKPGETLLERLVSNGTMPKVAMGHNFVLLKPTANPLEVSNAGLEHRDHTNGALSPVELDYLSSQPKAVRRSYERRTNLRIIASA